MNIIRKLVLSIRLRLSNQARLSLACRIKGSNLHIGARSKVHKEVTLDASGRGTIHLGNDVTLNRQAILIGGSAGIHIDDGVEINCLTFIDGSGGVSIGHRTLIGPGVKIISYKHGIEGHTPIKQQATTHAPVEIKNDVWIGAGATILAGVRIGEGAVIGAGAVVTRDIPAWAVAIGQPARVARFRDPD